jgi:hypothetical protein
MEPYAVDVTNFEVRYDLTQLIDPMGMIYSVPDADNNCRTVSQLLADYTQDDNKFKSLVLTKYILWDYTELQQAIIGAFRSVGYYGEIAITFPKEQYEISVHSAHRMRKLARNNLVRALCFVTCLWVIAGPAYVFSRHRNADTLQATFRMRISPREWLQSNYWSIISNIKCNYK